MDLSLGLLRLPHPVLEVHLLLLKRVEDGLFILAGVSKHTHMRQLHGGSAPRWLTSIFSRKAVSSLSLDCLAEVSCLLQITSAFEFVSDRPAEKTTQSALLKRSERRKEKNTLLPRTHRSSSRSRLTPAQTVHRW